MDSIELHPVLDSKLLICRGESRRVWADERFLSPHSLSEREHLRTLWQTRRNEIYRESPAVGCYKDSGHDVAEENRTRNREPDSFAVRRVVVSALDMARGAE